MTGTVTGRFEQTGEGRTITPDADLRINFNDTTEARSAVFASPDDSGDISVDLIPGEYRVEFVKNQRNPISSITITIVDGETVNLIEELAKRWLMEDELANFVSPSDA